MASDTGACIVAATILGAAVKRRLEDHIRELCIPLINAPAIRPDFHGVQAELKLQSGG
jgi:hypothetical protein